MAARGAAAQPARRGEAGEGYGGMGRGWARPRLGRAAPIGRPAASRSPPLAGTAARGAVGDRRRPDGAVHAPSRCAMARTGMKRRSGERPAEPEGEGGGGGAVSGSGMKRPPAALDTGSGDK